MNIIDIFKRIKEIDPIEVRYFSIRRDSNDIIKSLKINVGFLELGFMPLSLDDMLSDDWKIDYTNCSESELMSGR